MFKHQQLDWDLGPGVLEKAETAKPKCSIPSVRLVVSPQLDATEARTLEHHYPPSPKVQKGGATTINHLVTMFQPFRFSSGRLPMKLDPARPQ